MHQTSNFVLLNSFFHGGFPSFMTHFLGSGIPTQTLDLCPGCNHGKWMVWVGIPEPKDVSCRPGAEDCILDFTLFFFSDQKVHPRLLRRYDHLVPGHHVSRQWCWSWHGCNIPSDFLLGEVEDDEHLLIKSTQSAKWMLLSFPNTPDYSYVWGWWNKLFQANVLKS